MIFELTILGGIFYLGYRVTRKPSQVRTVASIIVTTRAEDAGAAGEKIAHAKLAESLERLCGSNYYLHEGSLIIEHAPSATFPTAEIDHLAVTPFGVFVFETKHWSGRIDSAGIAGELVRTAGDGSRENRKSPLAQNASKVEFLRRHLPPIWPVIGAGIFTSPGVVLAPDLALDLFCVADLPQWLSQKQASRLGKTQIDVRRATAAILRFADFGAFAAERHRQTVRQGT
jgi:Nuclease-related domain